MPLPKIESLRYPIVIPSLNRRVEFRPFTVKEQKVLMIAQEAKSNEEGSNGNVVQLKAICDLIEACTFGSITDATKLKLYDIEYLLVKIRSKSVGENSSVTSKCANAKCGLPVVYNIDLDKVKVEHYSPRVSNKIQLSKSVFIELREPNVGDLIDIMETDKNERAADDDIETIVRCIDKVYDNEKIYTDFTKKELIEFVENLDIHSMNSIQSYFENQPKLIHDIATTCKHCNEENFTTVEGAHNFFE